MKKYMTLSHKKTATCLAAAILCLSEATYSSTMGSSTMGHSLGTPLRTTPTTIDFGCWDVGRIIALDHSVDQMNLTPTQTQELLENYQRRAPSGGGGP